MRKIWFWASTVVRVEICVRVLAVVTHKMSVACQKKKRIRFTIIRNVGFDIMVFLHCHPFIFPRLLLPSLLTYHPPPHHHQQAFLLPSAVTVLSLFLTCSSFFWQRAKPNVQMEKISWVKCKRKINSRFLLYLFFFSAIQYWGALEYYKQKISPNKLNVKRDGGAGLTLTKKKKANRSIYQNVKQFNS